MSPQRIGEWVLVASAAIALALVLILTSFATGPAASGPAAAEAADCVPVKHTKTVTKKVRVKRNGKVRKVKRKRKVHWTTCEPVPVAPTCAVPSSNLGVTARDSTGLSFTLSRSCVTAGTVSVQLNNQGEDPHNLSLAPEGTQEAVYAIPDEEPFEVPPLGQDEGEFALSAGEWRLWCDIDLHAEQGMAAQLSVR